MPPVPIPLIGPIAQGGGREDIFRGDKVNDLVPLKDKDPQGLFGWALAYIPDGYEPSILQVPHPNGVGHQGQLEVTLDEDTTHGGEHLPLLAPARHFVSDGFATPKSVDTSLRRLKRTSHGSCLFCVRTAH